MPDLDRASGDDADWVLIGVVAGAHGVRGEMKIDLQTDFPERFKRLSTVYTGEEHRPLQIAAVRKLGDRVALRVDAVTDRDAAQAMRGTELYIPISEIMPLPEHSYYRDQIIGLRVETTSGEPIGTITEILVTGSNDVYVAKDEQREILIPALKDIVREVDLEGGRMVIEPVDGLL